MVWPRKTGGNSWTRDGDQQLRGAAEDRDREELGFAREREGGIGARTRKRTIDIEVVQSTRKKK